jgi:dihydrofolate reductase
MRKIVMFNFVSLDGFYAGEGDDISWHTVDAEFDNFSAELIKRFDAVIFGRITYDLFAGFWPKVVDDPKAGQADRTIAKALDDMTKIVFSHGGLQPEWKGTEVHNEIDPEFIKKLKEQPGKDIVIYGSGTIVRQLTDLGLIDEYKVIIAPVILGKGKQLFNGAHQANLTHIETRDFRGGNVLLTYAPFKRMN